MATKAQQINAARALLNASGFSLPPVADVPDPTPVAPPKSTALILDDNGQIPLKHFPPSIAGYRGAWASGVDYRANELVTVNNALQVVTTPHTSSGAFDQAKFAAVHAKAVF